MQVRLAIIFAVAASLAAPVQAASPDVMHLTYNVYAAGLHVAEVDTRFATGPQTYQMEMEYHTTGLSGFFYRGHQVTTVSGIWQDMRALPASFDGTGVWRGEERVARIDYDDGRPIIRTLTPPNEAEREPVPQALQAHSIDALSALMELIRTVTQTGHCELTVRTYDGRRATEIEARSTADEIPPYSPRSIYQGRAQRCDFAGKMLAGFKFGDTPSDFKPLHGSAWLAHLTPSGPLVPVRMTFETRWFGDATMFLTSAAPDDESSMARK